MMKILLIDYLLLPQFFVCCGALYYTLFIRKLNAPSLKRFYLVLLPLFVFVLPNIDFFTLENTLVEHVVLPEFVSATLGVSRHIETSYSKLLLAVYALGMLLFLTRFLWGLYQISQLKRRAILQHQHQISFYYNKQVKGHFSIFFNIYTNQEQPDFLILKHEKMHIDLGHFFDLLYFEILRIIFWFNPIYHLLLIWVKENHEWQVDAKMQDQYEVKNYQSILKNEAVSSYLNLSMVQQFSVKNQLKTRITMMNQNQKTRQALCFVSALMLVMAFVAPFASKAIHVPSVNAQSLLEASEPDSKPSFPGGMEALVSYLSSNIKYPEVDKLAKRTGKVFVEFVVEKTGAISKVKILRSGTNEMNNEAIRVIEAMPKWEAAIQDGKAVNAKMVLPIAFALPAE